MKKAVVFTLGCKVNRYESDCLMQELERKGYEVSDQPEYADIYILNTCAVTQEAEKKSRQAVARCRKCNPNGRIFVVGCASQNNPKSFEKDGVEYIGGTGRKMALLEHLTGSERVENVLCGNECFEEYLLCRPTRTRSFIKIQDGCNNFCSYCLIPYLRGRSRSRTIENIVKEAEILSEKVPEIVLTGINVMAFGSDTGESLDKLIHALRNIPARIRLSSFYAEGITEKLLDELFSLPDFCPHFHLSLQSGDRDVLQKMNRHYTPEEYRKKIELIRSYEKNASIATDIIVGFPTEEASMFENTYRFAEEVAFSDLHIFPYSARKGTVAYRYPVLSPSLVEERKIKMIALKKELRALYLKKNIGTAQEVLIEEKIGEEYIGYTKNYIKMYTDSPEELQLLCATNLYKDGLK